MAYLDYLHRKPHYEAEDILEGSTNVSGSEIVHSYVLRIKNEVVQFGKVE